MNYLQVKVEKEAEVAKRREDSKKELKHHYGSLKFKPKKAVAIESYMSDAKGQEGSLPLVESLESLNEKLRTQISDRSAISNRYQNELR